MRILVLGASSAVGTALAAAFAPGNELLLCGRDAARLAEGAKRCKEAGAARVECLEQDLARGVEGLQHRLALFTDGAPVDLLIDAASAGSRRRDDALQAADLSELVQADFAAKVALLEGLLQQPCAPGVIFISTVLTLVKSPERAAYAALKTLHELYLEKRSREQPGFKLLVVRIGAVLDTHAVTPKHMRMAAAARRAYQEGRASLFVGTSGRLFTALFYIQPLLFLVVAKLRRSLSRRET